MNELALLRHGHTGWNRAGRIQGRTDIPLDVEARLHLGQMALPKDWQAAEVVSSPLSRARDTAELVSGQAPKLVAALTEMNWGQWEGLRGEDLIAEAGSGYRHLEDWGWDYRPPGGESPRDVLARLAPWVEGLHQRTLAVCHIGIMRVILARAHDWNFRGTPPFRIKRDRLYVLRISADGWHPHKEPIRLEVRAG